MFLSFAQRCLIFVVTGNAMRHVFGGGRGVAQFVLFQSACL
jgi:hypothetical protein